MKFRWSILCWKKHHKSKRASPKVVRMPTMSTHQHECTSWRRVTSTSFFQPFLTNEMGLCLRKVSRDTLRHFIGFLNGVSLPHHFFNPWLKTFYWQEGFTSTVLDETTVKIFEWDIFDGTFLVRLFEWDILYVRYILLRHFVKYPLVRHFKWDILSETFCMLYSEWDIFGDFKHCGLYIARVGTKLCLPFPLVLSKSV